MERSIIRLAAIAMLLVPACALAQSPPPEEPKAAPTPSRSGQCAEPTPPATTGRGDADVAKPDGSNLSQKLAQSNGVLCPPDHVDPAMRRPTPPDSGRMRVIPPPGTPGSSDPAAKPK